MPLHKGWPGAARNPHGYRSVSGAASGSDIRSFPPGPHPTSFPFQKGVVSLEPGKEADIHERARQAGETTR